MSFPIPVVYEDADVVAVHKPAGLAVHRSHLVGRDDAYLVDLVREQTGRTLYLAHRLDRATSGVQLFAASKEVAAALGEQFMGRTIGKAYLAVVRGFVDDSGVIDHPLDAPGQKQAKAAITRYRRLGTLEVPVPMGRYEVQRYSLVEARPETGRYRQIRRHFKHVSHHLVGDTTEGRGEHNRLWKMQFGIHRMLLHAVELSLAHPADGRPLTLRAEPDGEMAKAVNLFAGGALVAPPLDH